MFCSFRRLRRGSAGRARVLNWPGSDVAGFSSDIRIPPRHQRVELASYWTATARWCEHRFWGTETTGRRLSGGALGGPGMGFAWIPEVDRNTLAASAEPMQTGERHSHRKGLWAVTGGIVGPPWYPLARPLLGLRASAAAATARTDAAARAAGSPTTARHRSGFPAGR